MRLLIVKLSSLGDILHVLPTVHALRVHLRAEIDWAVHPEYASLVRCFEDVDRVLPVPRRRIFREGCAALRSLRARRYDLVVDLQGLLKSAVTARCARSVKRIGPSFHREGAHWLYHAVAGPPRKDRHAVSQAMDVLSFLGIPIPDSCGFPIRAPAITLDLPRPWIAVAPFSRWVTKNWPEHHFLELAQRLQLQRTAGIVWLGGAGEQDALARLARQCPGPTANLAGQLDLAALAGVLAGVNVLVANDSGPVHLAAALGRPCVVMYGPTNPRQTGPWGDRHQVIRTGFACAGCGRRDCPLDRSCMGDISTGRVLRAVEALLESPPQRKTEIRG